MKNSSRYAIGILLPFIISVPVALQAQEREKVALDSPEGWAMAHTIAATLNLGALPPARLEPWKINVSAELGSIPRLSTEEQRVGFGGFKFEDMNKSPVFGRGRLQLGLPSDFTVELSWTPPLKINGVKPVDLFGLAIQRPLLHFDRWHLGGRVFMLRGHARGDIACSKDVVAEPPGSAGNPFGCRERSDDRSSLDHEGIEIMFSHLLSNERWQPYVALAWTRIHPEARVQARVFAVFDESTLTADGTLLTASLGTAFYSSANWHWSAAFSYTPLQVKRPPLRESRNGDFWSVRLGLSWSGF